MARKGKQLLTYYPPRKGWVKVIDGKARYFALGTATGPDDTASFEKALGEYLALKDRLDSEAVAKVEAQLQGQKLPNGSNLDTVLAFTDYGALKQKRNGTHTPTSPTFHKTIQGLVAVFLEHRKTEADSGQISQASYASDKWRLGDFLGFCNGEGVSKLDEVIPDKLWEYHDLQKVGIAEGVVSPVNAKHRLGCLKKLLQWAYDQELVPTLPRGIKRLAKIKVPEPKPRFFSVEEFKTLYQKASPRTRLYILLGLNAGYTQADIASLEHSQVDWETGLVTRDRHKTRQPQQAKLWPLTLKLLREHATDPKASNLLLLGEGGHSLIVERIKSDGTPYKVDAIRLAFNRLRHKCKVNDSRGFAIFRKTGADAIAKQYQDKPFLVDLYLAHSQKGMKKHYANQHYELLHSATDWLAKAFEVSGLEGKPEKGNTERKPEKAKAAKGKTSKTTTTKKG